jgi:competence protein ComEC
MTTGRLASPTSVLQTGRVFASTRSWRSNWVGLELTVIAPPPGEHFSETNDNSVAILLIYGTTRVLLAGETEVREEHMASASYTRP